MATVDINLATVEDRSKTTDAMPVISAVPIDTDLITSSGTSQQSDFASPADTGEGMYWVLTVTGGAVRAKFGADPTAAAAEGGGWLILDGQTREFAAVPGQKVAIIDA